MSGGLGRAESLVNAPVPMSVEREQLLLEEARLLRELAHNVPVAIAYYESQEFRCQFANRGYATMFGLDEQQILGKTFAEVIGDDAAEQIQPRVDAVLRERRTASYEREMTAASGELRTIEVTLVPHLDATRSGVSGAFVLIADITRHRRAEHAVRESEERLARFMHATAEGIVFHHEGFITDANPPLLDLVGYTLEELRGRWVLDVVAPDQRERVSKVMTARAELRYESAIQHRDGHSIPVEFIVRTMMVDGQSQRMTIVRDMRDRLAAQARIEHLARHDSLTGLPNRAEFIERFQQRLPQASTSDTLSALLFVDLDHFKRVNDSLGHLVGDVLLRTVASRITETLRASDLVARFGGDEFLVLLGGDLDRHKVGEVASKLVSAIEAAVEVEGATISVTPSIGIAVFPDDGTTADELIQHADTAMYHAKSQGRAAYRFFAREMAEQAYRELVMEGQLAQALQAGHFELRYQPQVRAADSTVVAVEALIRWQHPERGLLEPAEFIALAEARRLIVPIGRWVLDQALAAAAGWREQGFGDVPVAVNLSTTEFRTPGFVEAVQAALTARGLPGSALELELTERMLMDDIEAVRVTLERLKALGVRIAVDDFGTGYTSLSHLRDLPIDRLKIDRSFISDLPLGGGSAAIARAIIQLADALGLSVVAEGVETQAQRDWVVEHGCTELQGYLILAPVDGAALTTWLAAHPRV